MIVFHILLVCISNKAYSFVDNRLVLPQPKIHRVDCQDALEQVQSGNRVKPSTQLNTGGGGSNPGLVVSYIPQCRPDRPSLFKARQCSQHDCFCVNITTGKTLLGTVAKKSEVGNCSMAVYSIFLAIYQSPLTDNAETYQRPTDHVKQSNSFRIDGVARLRIKEYFEGLMRSVRGYQRITNVTRSEMANRDHSEKLLYYHVQLISIGHTSVDDPLKLIQDRLQEGIMLGVGRVKSSISNIKLDNTNVDDPERLHIWDGIDASARISTIASGYYYAKTEDLASLPSLGSADNGGSTRPNYPPRSENIYPRSLTSDVKTKPQIRSVLGISLLGHGNNDGGGGGGLYNVWSPGRSSVWNQPGAIAGIVGVIILFVFLLITLIIFCIYRWRKRDEGSYALEEPRKPATMNSSTHTHASPREFYA